MGLSEWSVMDMLVMLVMHMRVLVLQHVVQVLVVVALGQMEPQANPHEGSCTNKLNRDRLAQNRHCKNRADEGSQREVGSCPSGPKMSKPEHEHHKADTHAEEANESTCQDKSGARQGCAKQDG